MSESRTNTPDVLALDTVLTLPQRAAAALGAAEHETKLVELAAIARTITVIVNADGAKQCHATRMMLKNTRVGIEKAGKGAREDAQAFSKAVIAEEKRLVAIIATEEERLEQLQSAWETAREAERQAKALAEHARVTALRARVSQIERAPMEVFGSDAASVAERLAFIEALEIGDDFAELRLEAHAAKTDSIEALKKMHVTAIAYEAEQSRLATERAELERQKAEQQRAENERRVQAEREVAEAAAKLAAERAELEREQAKVRAQKKALDDAAAEQRAAEQARADAGRIEAENRKCAVREADTRAADNKRLAEDLARAAAENRAKEQERIAQASRTAAEERVRNAAPIMLKALQALRNMPLPASAMAIVTGALAESEPEQTFWREAA